KEANEYQFHQFESVEKLPSSLRRIADLGRKKMENDLLLRFGKTQIENNQGAVNESIDEFLDNPLNMQLKVTEWEGKLMENRDTAVIESGIVSDLSSELLDHVSVDVFNAKSGADLERINNVIIEDVAESVKNRFDNPEDENLSKIVNEVINRNLLEFKNIIKYSKVSDRELVVKTLSDKTYNKVDSEFSAYLDGLIDDALVLEDKKKRSDAAVEIEEVKVTEPENIKIDLNLISSSARDIFEKSIKHRIKKGELVEWVMSELDKDVFGNKKALDDYRGKWIKTVNGNGVDNIELATEMAKDAVRRVVENSEFRRLAEIE
ncbi:hypothetical protein ACFL3M_03540, partial [Patescibacteria group bacterium]